MNTATTMVYEILNDSDAMQGIDFFTNSVPEEHRVLDNLPVGRIVELQGEYGNFASGDPRTITFYVQVDIWLKNQEQAERYYYVIDKLLREQGWLNDYSSLEEDPDLQPAKRIVKRYNGTLHLTF